MNRIPKYIILIGSLIILALVVGFGMRAQLGDMALLLAVSLLLIAIFVGLFRYAFVYSEKRIAGIMRKELDTALKVQNDHLEQRDLVEFWQHEALLNIIHTIQPKIPLPPTRKWAASPDLLRLVMHEMFANRPEYVVEASSGTSTLVIAYCLQKFGKGKVYSLEHDLLYADRTRAMIKLHGLEEYAQVVDAPLIEHVIEGVQRKWYDTAGLLPNGKIDLMVVDGPPQSIQKLARYPALPLLRSLMAAKFTIIMDDGGRDDEREIASRWAKECGAKSNEFIPLEKGAWLIKS